MTSALPRRVVPTTQQQVQWHPYSDDHLVLLTSDNRLRLYNVPHSLAVAEQTFHAASQAAATPARYGMGTAAEAAGASTFVAFAFGPPAGWGTFTALLLSSAGLVYSLCPVAPFGAFPALGPSWAALHAARKERRGGTRPHC